jgi:hypothetical protein
MKEMIICTAFLLISSSSFCQNINSKPALTQEDYLRKSKSRKLEGYFLLSLGTFVFTIAAIEGDVGCAFCSTEIPVVPLSIGAAMMVGSIPLFIRSKTLKRKAMSLSFKNETIPQMQPSSIVYRPVPSLSLRFGL